MPARHPEAKGVRRPSSAGRWAYPLAALVLAGTLTACGGTSPASTGKASTGKVSITLYNGQHVETTGTLVAGFEKATGITVNVRSDDEDVLADEIVTEGARSPADVILYRELPRPRVPPGQGAPGQDRPVHLGAGRRASTTLPTGTG